MQSMFMKCINYTKPGRTVTAADDQFRNRNELNKRKSEIQLKQSPVSWRKQVRGLYRVRRELLAK